jgi:plastocyanin
MRAILRKSPPNYSNIRSYRKATSLQVHFGFREDNGVMFKVAILMASGAAWLVASHAGAQPAGPEMVSVHLTNFAFTPETLHLRAGSTIVLHIVNDSNGGHNLSAPKLFAASAFPAGLPPADGKVEVGSKQSKDILFVPRVPGRYRVECTHFLHSLFGMTGDIIVDGPAP